MNALVAFKTLFRSFEDPTEESMFRVESLVAHWRLIFASALTLCLSSVTAIAISLYTTDELETSMGYTAIRVLFFFPFVVAGVTSIVAGVPRLRQRYMVRYHTAFIIAIALSYCIHATIYSSLRGRPASILWVPIAIFPPVMLQARFKAVLLYNAVHTGLALFFYFVVGNVDHFARSRQDLYFARTARFYSIIALCSLAGLAGSVMICARMESFHRALFKERLSAIAGAALLRELEERGKLLLHRVLPATVAQRAETHKDLTFAEVSNLVGVLVIRFARPYPPDDPDQPATADRATCEVALSRVRKSVERLDELLARICGTAVERIRVVEGVYMAASNVAVSSPNDSDPGQRFLALTRFGVAAIAAIPGARAGLHIGSCASGVLGTSRVTFDLFGEAVNMAMGLCDTAVGGFIFCSAAARAMIPRNGAKWRKAMDVQCPASGQVFTAFPLQRLNESNLPAEGEPSMPYDAQAEPIDLGVISAALAPQLQHLVTLRDQQPLSPTLPPKSISPTLVGLRQASSSSLLGSPLLGASAYAASTTVPNESGRTSLSDRDAAAETRFLIGEVPEMSGEVVTSARAPRAAMTPELRTLRDGASLAAVETARSNPFTMAFKDRNLEARFQDSMYREDLPYELCRIYVAAGLVLMLIAFACELLSIDSTSWTAVILTGMASAINLIVYLYGPTPMRVSFTILVGALVLCACQVLAFGTPGAELRLMLLFVDQVYVAATYPSYFPVAVAANVCILSSMIALFERHGTSYFTLITRSSFVFVAAATFVSTIWLRYFGEKEMRQRFLLTQHTVSTEDIVRAEVSQSLRLLNSCLPSSLIASFIKSKDQKDIMTSQESGHLLLQLNLEKLMPDTVLVSWPVLSCTLGDLPTIVTELNHSDLVTFLRHFFLLVESAAGVHDCEVARSYNGSVMICPKLEGRESITAANAAARVVSVGIAIANNIVNLNPLLERFHRGRRELNPPFVQIGVATGACVAGMVGKSKGFFELIGPAPSTAIFLASKAPPNKILFNKQTAALVREFDPNLWLSHLCVL
jgi:class 3 adenylate cyclase